MDIPRDEPLLIYRPHLADKFLVSTVVIGKNVIFVHRHLFANMTYKCTWKCLFWWGRRFSYLNLVMTFCISERIEYMSAVRHAYAAKIKTIASYKNIDNGHPLSLCVCIYPAGMEIMRTNYVRSTSRWLSEKQKVTKKMRKRRYPTTTPKFRCWRHAARQQPAADVALQSVAVWDVELWLSIAGR